ncbi:MAG: hypothetical protein JXJ20_09560 [Anaerolineae bacterium]|jgi:hypothetical protein|nr:hypothetical protein [Anaerolineae bacterium]
MSHLKTAGILLSFAAVGMAACTPPDSDQPVPTVADINQLPTSIFLTENAPPPGFGEVAFNPIDANLSDRQGWTYTATGRFEGTFAGTDEPAEGTFEAQVWANELGEARRVVLQIEGVALSPEEKLLTLEGVRLSNDYYIVDNNGQCTVGGDSASVIADLSAGQLIGGVVRAVPTGHQQAIDGMQTWQYTFALQDMRFPAVHVGADSRVTPEADLWIAPEINAVLLFEATLTVENVRILSAERPVSGTLYLRYELSVTDLDVLPNISIPHGC